MPGLNGTGPMGMGPMTGGRRGFCNPSAQPFVQIGSRPWLGGGRGFRNMFWATGLPGWVRTGLGGYEGLPYYSQHSREQETGFLKNQAAALKEGLEVIDNRLRDIEDENKAGD